MHRLWRLLLCLACLLVMTQAARSDDELHPTPWFVDFVGEQSNLSGQPLPVGAVVRAYDPSRVLAGCTEVTLSGWYLMAVYGDDPLTELDEGAESGETITFTINGQAATPLGPDQPLWTASGQRLHVELSAYTLFGDLDGDCDVDIVDIMMVASKWCCQRGDECYAPRCDLDGDGEIDIVDIMKVAAHWGEVCSPSRWSVATRSGSAGRSWTGLTSTSNRNYRSGGSRSCAPSDRLSWRIWRADTPLTAANLATR